ncbi:MAG: GerMN domain-containing protein [Acidimicrobiales bacterium]
MSRRRHGARWVGAAALALALSGCGIALQTSAQPFKVPANQFASPTTLPTSTHPGRAIDVYFLTNGYVIASVRHLPRGRLSLDRTLQLALNWLDAGPSSVEFGLGISTALSVSPAATVTLIGTLKHHVASVDLDLTFENLDTSELFEADAQIVYTLTQFHQVGAVNLLLGGVRTAYLPDGVVLNKRPVTREDYRAIAPPTKP